VAEGYDRDLNDTRANRDGVDFETHFCMRRGEA
jgi:hypothetical protein